MSKASEWAKIKPEDFAPYDRTVADVSINGYLNIRDISLAPQYALKLRDWLTETFED